MSFSLREILISALAACVYGGISAVAYALFTIAFALVYRVLSLLPGAVSYALCRTKRLPEKQTVGRLGGEVRDFLFTLLFGGGLAVCLFVFLDGAFRLYFPLLALAAFFTVHLLAGRSLITLSERALGIVFSWLSRVMAILFRPVFRVLSFVARSVLQPLLLLIRRVVSALSDDFLRRMKLASVRRGNFLVYFDKIHKKAVGNYEYI